MKTLGWREWVSLPALGVEKIKCKVDTGARTSCLHAYYVDTYDKDGVSRVRFGLHPNQGDTNTVIHCDAAVLDHREVTDSGGHTERRVVIRSLIHIGEDAHEIEFTLTNRDNMKFRMLLGRTALHGRYLVDSSLSFTSSSSS